MTLVRIHSGSGACTRRSADRQLSVWLDTSYVVARGSGGRDRMIMSPTKEGLRLTHRGSGMARMFVCGFQPLVAHIQNGTQ